MNITDNSLWLLFVGSFLTFLAAWAVEYWKYRKESEDKRKNFVVFTKLELQSVLKALEKLNNTFSDKSYFSFIILDRLDRNSANLENARKEAIYLRNVVDQQKYIDLVSDLSMYLVDTRSIENFYSEQNKHYDDKGNKKDEDGIFDNRKDLLEHSSKRRTEKLIELIDLKRRIEDFIRILNE